MSESRRDRLGRGLGALLGDYIGEEAPPGSVQELPVGAILPNPLQPRREFSDTELEELAASISANGLIQTLVVRPSPSTPNRFELVAGERRLRAVRRLGWTHVPATVREVDNEALLVLALVENLQREALGALEEAEGFHTLVERFGMTQEEIGRAVGKDRSTVANTLRLLRLPPSVRKLLDAGKISAGHARALLSVDDPMRAAELARRAAAEEWSVREMERHVRAEGKEERPRAAAGEPSGRDPHLRALEEELRAALGTRAKLKLTKGGAGTIEIPFTGREDFERLFEVMTGREASEVLG